MRNVVLVAGEEMSCARSSSNSSSSSSVGSSLIEARLLVLTLRDDLASLVFDAVVLVIAITGEGSSRSNSCETSSSSGVGSGLLQSRILLLGDDSRVGGGTGSEASFGGRGVLGVVSEVVGGGRRDVLLLRREDGSAEDGLRVRRRSRGVGQRSLVGLESGGVG